MSTGKAILFLGATGGCAFSTLHRSIAAGHACIAVCRTPSKLTAQLSAEQQAHVTIIEGNAHDAAVLRTGLIHPSKPKTLVDHVVSALGNPITMEGLLKPDGDVCRHGMEVLLQSITALRTEGYAGRPRITGVSSTGLSEVARDVPIPFVPLYKVILHSPHKDKRGMEALMMASGEDWTIIRASLLTSGPGGQKPVRAGMEDPVAKKVESAAIGYSITREDVGKWIFENVIEGDATWVAKVATVTY
ncbi:hypothetical protein QBC47DRAFT_125454 [Echria macrotheca]|uniref:NAD(P)-binding domain-containing protein n=1 Tax=Echria macrotheca TaxID=438768 RepID=A0AAJ0F4B1_9PEZI|nr:hypothetical protein QBC47DRAFT_125454 [Echria macrotheca]